MHRHDVLEGCLREIEADQTVDSAGYGGFPNIIGEMELDASCMNGDDRAIGAVAAAFPSDQHCATSDGQRTARVADRRWSRAICG